MNNSKIVDRQKEISDEYFALLRDVCKARGENISNFVRRSVRKELVQLSYLSPYKKKALGVLEK